MPIPVSEEKQLEWKTLVEQQGQSGLSISRWCLQRQIKTSTFYYWRDKFSSKQLQKSSFTEVNAKRSDGISLQARGVCIRISSDCDPQMRKKLFSLFAEG
jgi:transposase-like protein